MYKGCIKLRNSLDVKAVPLSITISFGFPKILNKSFKLLITSLLMVLIGKSQVNLVNEFMLYAQSAERLSSKNSTSPQIKRSYIS